MQLDPSDTSVALQQAEANLAKTVRQTRGLYRSVEGAQADLNARQVTLKRVREDFARRRIWPPLAPFPTKNWPTPATSWLRPKRPLPVRRAQPRAGRRHVIATQPDVQAAAAAAPGLPQQRPRIVAPVTGYVARRSVQVGQRVQPGNALMAVVPTEQMWVEANFKETQLRHMRLGQEVELKSDLYAGDVKYKGRIQSLGLGTGSAFSLLPAERQRQLDQDRAARAGAHRHRCQAAGRTPLRIGLSMKAEVSLRDQKGEVLPSTPAKGTVFDTDVYAKQLHDADEVIHTIIQGNLPQQQAKVG